MKTELEEVHGDGGRLWTPVVFPSYNAHQRPILVGGDELVMAELLDISAWSEEVGDDEIEHGELRPDSGKMDSIRSILGFPARSRWLGGRGQVAAQPRPPHARVPVPRSSSSSQLRNARPQRTHGLVRSFQNQRSTKLRTVSLTRSCF